MALETGARLVLSGVAALLVSGLIYFGRSDPVKPAGQLAQGLSALIDHLALEVGARVSTEGCTMMGNINLGVTCVVEGTSLPAMGDALVRGGWTVVPDEAPASVGEQRSFMRDDILLFVFSRSGSVQSITARRK